MKTSLLAFLLASTTAFAATEEHVTTNFPAASGGTLVVDINFGAISVDTNLAAGQISVDVRREITRKTPADEQRFLLNHPVQFVSDGKALKVLCKGKEESLRAKDRTEAKYTLLVPAQFNCQLHTSGGEISVANLTGETVADTGGGRLRFNRLHGPLTSHTSGGDVSVAETEGVAKLRTSGGRIEVSSSGGSLDAKTSGGDVKVQTFDGPASVETSGGSMTLSSIAGNLSASTSGGRISLQMVAPVSGDVSLSSSGGDVTLEAPDNAAFALDAHTSGGHVSCDLPLTMKGTSASDRLNGKVNGGGPNVVLRTGGGEIRVKKSATVTSLER